MITKKEILIEEMSELTKAIMKEKRYIENDPSLTWTKEEILDNIKEELVQVSFLIEKVIREVFDNHEEFIKYQKYELKRHHNRGIF